MRLGIFGGSFDPIHIGHVAAAEAARRMRSLVQVFLVPAASPPHKEGGCAAPFSDRVAMARLAVSGRGGLEVLDLEGHRPGPSYTVDTLAELRRAYRGASFDLLLGADMLADLPRWHRAADLVAAVRVVAFGRPGADLAAAREAYEAAFGAACDQLEFAPLPATSTDVRRRLAAGEAVGDLLAPDVLAYIQRHGLYVAPEGG